MACHFHLRLSLGSWEDSFDTSVSFRDIENQHGNYSIWYGPAERGFISRTTGYSRNMGKGNSRILSLYKCIKL